MDTNGTIFELSTGFMAQGGLKNQKETIAKLEEKISKSDFRGIMEKQKKTDINSPTAIITPLTTPEGNTDLTTDDFKCK